MQYSPLDNSKFEIRVLAFVQPARQHDSEQLRLTLQRVSLLDITSSFQESLTNNHKHPKRLTWKATKDWAATEHEQNEPGFHYAKWRTLPSPQPVVYNSERIVDPTKYIEAWSDDDDSYVSDDSKVEGAPEKTYPQIKQEFAEFLSSDIRSLHFCPYRFNWGDFCAISYCWGDIDQSTTEIMVNGQPFRLPVSHKHALETLYHLPEASRGMSFWMDYICIDQQDTAEKAQQIALMHQIYTSAFSVINYLGPENEESETACSLLSTLSVLSDIPDGFDVTFKYDVWVSLHLLLGRPFWTRLWIVQEQALNHNQTLFCLGKYQFSRSSIVRACRACEGELEDDIIAQGWIWQGMLRLYTEGTLNLLTMSYRPTGNIRESLFALYKLGRRSEAREDHDKVYGLLGLLPPSIATKIKPSYELNVAQVYTNFALAVLRATSRLEYIFLAHTGLYTHGPTPRTPSWVPDWRITHPETFRDGYDRFQADGRRAASWSLSEDGLVLLCKGVFCGSLEVLADDDNTFPRHVNRQPHMVPTAEKQAMQYQLASILLQPETWEDMPDEESSSEERSDYLASSSSSDADEEDEPFNDSPKSYSVQPAVLSGNEVMPKLVEPLFKMWWPKTFSPKQSEELRKQFEEIEMRELYDSPDWSFFSSIRKKLTKFPLSKQLAFKDMFPKMSSWTGPGQASGSAGDGVQSPETDGIDEKETSHAKSTPKILERLTTLYSQSQLVKTSNGNLGLVPEAARKGDVIAVLYGCSYPVVLRRVEGQDQYQYVGESYIHGLMKGEAFTESPEEQIIAIS